MNELFQFKTLSFSNSDEQEIISYVESLEKEIKSCHAAFRAIGLIAEDYVSAASAEENIEE